MKKTTKEANGTSFHDTTIRCSVKLLKEILGECTYGNNDGQDKVNYEWIMETEDGDVYLKHEDYKNKFIKLDELLNKFQDQVYLSIVLHQEEKEFISNFLLGTKYEYLIPHILNQKY